MSMQSKLKALAAEMESLACLFESLHELLRGVSPLDGIMYRRLAARIRAALRRAGIKAKPGRKGK